MQHIQESQTYPELREQLLDSVILDILNLRKIIIDEETNLKAQVSMVCGYVGTGKDTFQHNKYIAQTYQALAIHPKDLEAFNYIVNTSRISFADKLKDKVVEKFDLPEWVWENKNKIIDSDKIRLNQEDQAGLIARGFPVPCSFRHLLIYYAEKIREDDPDHWVRKSARAIQKPYYPFSFTVTDFRYPNEYEYFLHKKYNVNTIRLFRKDVPVPDAALTSEHTLQNFITDYVLIPKKDFDAEFAALVEIFPQYKNYKPVKNFNLIGEDA